MSDKPTATQSISPTRHRSGRLYARFNPGICVDHALSRLPARLTLTSAAPAKTRGCGGGTGNVDHL
jgi:hypothetical protein